MSDNNNNNTSCPFRCDLAEFIGEVDSKTPVSVYWGTAPTGLPHVGYLIPLIKLGQLIIAGVKVKVLLADVHAALDQVEDNDEKQVQARTQVYQIVIEHLLDSVLQNILGVETKEVRSQYLSQQLFFVKGSDFQNTTAYFKTLLKFSTQVRERDAIKAGSEVVHNNASSSSSPSPLLCSMLYPLMQAMDESFLECQGQLGGVDQRKIFTFAKDKLPKLHGTKFSKTFYMLNRMLPALQGKDNNNNNNNNNNSARDKMSATGTPKSKLSVLDSSDDVRKKINACFAEPLSASSTVLFTWIDYLFFVTRPNTNERGTFTSYFMDGSYFNKKIYHNKQEIVDDYNAGVIHPNDVKYSLILALNTLLDPLREHFQKDDMKQLLNTAYPSKLKM